MKLWSFVLAAMGFCVVLFGAEPVNLAENLDFSQQGSDKKFTYWRTRGAMTLTAHNGVLKIVPESAAGRKFLFQSPLLVKAGGKYELSYEVRGSENLRFCGYVEYKDKNNKHLGFYSARPALCKDFKKVKMSFMMPEGSYGAFLGFYISDGMGECELRNLKIEQVGQIDFKAIQRQKAAVAAFPVDGELTQWQIRGGTAEWDNNVLKLRSASAKGNVFFLKRIRPKGAGTYELTVNVKGTQGTYGAYLEYYTADKKYRGFNSQLRNLPHTNKFQVKVKFSVPEEIARATLVLSAGKSIEPVEFSDLKIKPLEAPADPTQASNWKGGKLIRKGGKTQLLLLNNQPAKAEVILRKNQYYRFGFDGATHKSTDLTSFADFRFRAGVKGKFFFETPWDDIISGSGSGKEIVFRSPVDGRGEFVLESTKGEVIIFALRLDEIVPEEATPVVMELDNPCYRNTIYTNRRGDISGRIKFIQPAVSAEVILTRADDNKVLMRTLSRGGKFVLPRSGQLPVGKYTLTIQPHDASGKALTAAKELIRVVAPPAVHYRFNPADNTFYRNDQAVHFHGFMHSYTRNLVPLYQQMGCTTFMTIAHTPEKLLKALDEAHKYNFRLVLDLQAKRFQRVNKDFLPEWKRVMRYVLNSEVLNHPALAGYCSVDEPAWGAFPIDQLAEVTRFIHDLDPSRPVWINEAPRGSVELNSRIAGLSDAFGVDIYPIPVPNGHSGLANKTITCVGEYTLRCREAAGKNHPIWMVIQGFAWNDLGHRRPNPVYPTPEQLRFMAMDSMIHGANATIFWGVSSIRQKQFYLDMLETVNEVTLLSKLWQAGNTVKVKAAPGMRVFAGKVAGKRYIVALNYTDKKLDSQIDLSGLYELPGGQKPQSTMFEAYTARIFSETGDYPGDFAPRVKVSEQELAAAMKELNKMFAPRRPYQGKASWIWYPGDKDVAPCSSTLYLDFDLKKQPVKAEFLAAADDNATLSVNGKVMGAAGNWNLMENYNVLKELKVGRNRLSANVVCDGALPSGFLAELRVTYADRTTEVFGSGSQWQAVKPGLAPRPAEVVATYGTGVWGYRVEVLAE